MSRQTKALALILGFLFSFQSASAADFSIVINEVNWMGDQNKTTNEWIELYNNQNQDLSLDGWILKIDGTEVKLSGRIAAQDFYLISRDKTIPADLYFNKALRNTGNQLTLLDSQKNIIDQMDWSKGWPTGDNKTKQTMERINPLSSGGSQDDWQTSAGGGGTPKQKNSPGATLPQAEKKTAPANVAKINSFSQQNQNPLSAKTILTALLLSIFSGGIILSIKNSFRKIS